MNFDFNDFINKQSHKRDIENKAQQIRNLYSPNPASTKEYLHSLYEFFFSDIECVANKLYEEILHKRDVGGGGVKVTSKMIKECVENGARSFLATYDSILNSYNMGGVFNHYDAFAQDKIIFDKNAESICIKQTEIFAIKYDKLLKEDRRAYFTFLGVMVGVPVGIATLVFTIIGIYHH